MGRWRWVAVAAALVMAGSCAPGADPDPTVGTTAGGVLPSTSTTTTDPTGGLPLIHNHSGASDSRVRELAAEAIAGLGFADPDQAPNEADRWFVGNYYMAWIDQTGFYGKMNGLWRLDATAGDALDFVVRQQGRPVNFFVVGENGEGGWPTGYSGAEHLEFPNGTPEPDDFDQDSGSVSLVEISAPGRQPAITRMNSATFSWRSAPVDLLHRQPTPGVVNEAISGIDAHPDSTVLRIELVGPVSPEQRDTLSSAVAHATEDYAVVLVDDRTSTVLSEPLWKASLQEHPLLAQVVADVTRSRLFNTGSPPTIDSTGLDELTLDEFQSLCADLNIEADQLRDGAFEAMMALLAAEVGKATTGGGPL